MAVVLIFASAALTAAVACLFLPETAGIKLPETFDDIKATPMYPPSPLIVVFVIVMFASSETRKACYQTEIF